MPMSWAICSICYRRMQSSNAVPVVAESTVSQTLSRIMIRVLMMAVGFP